MKFKIRKIALATLCILQVGQAFAQDSVQEQIRLTQDAVRISLNEIENGASQYSTGSLDGDEKVTAFNEANKVLLQKFEEAIRLQILTPLQVLVNEYNRTVANPVYTREVKAGLLSNLKAQIQQVADSRQLAYFNIIQGLYGGMGRFPVVTREVSDYRCEEIPTDFNIGFEDAKMKLTYEPTNFINSNGKYCRRPSGHMNHGTFGFLNLIVSRDFLIDGCFTSTCFLQTLNAYTVWNGIIENILKRDLDIKLQDGQNINIGINGNFISDDGEKIERKFVVTAMLQKSTPNDAIMGLLPDMGQDRLSALRKIESQLTATKLARNCKAVVASAKNLTCRTPEGCLTAIEKALLQKRISGMPSQKQRIKCLN